MKTKTLFFSSLVAAAAMSTVPAFADYTWQGGESITQDLWQTEGSWTLSSSWKTSGTGPGTPNSNMWDKIVIDGSSGNKISGSIASLEGWKLNLDLKNASLTVEKLVKFQGGCSISLDKDSVLKINSFGGKSEDALTLSGAGTIEGKMCFPTSVTLTNWTGTVKSVDLQKNDIRLSSYGTANSTVELSGFSGYFSEQNDGTVSANIKLTNSSTSGRAYAANISNGFSDKTLTFSGKISGDGKFNHAGGQPQVYKFTGDVSAFTGTLDSTESTFVFDLSSEQEFKGKITGGSKVEKKGENKLTLSGANTFSGDVKIEKGTVVAANVSALGTGEVTVASGAKLGLVAGTTVSGVTGGIELASGAKIVVDMTGQTSTAETFTLDLITGTVLKYNGEVVSSLNVGTLLGSAYELSNWDKTGWISTLSYADNKLSLTMSIPEPSSFGLLAGLGALALVGARRRRKTK